MLREDINILDTPLTLSNLLHLCGKVVRALCIYQMLSKSAALILT